jgi:hypothetical protein
MGFLEGYRGAMEPGLQLQKLLQEQHEARLKQQDDADMAAYLQNPENDPRELAANIMRRGGDPSFILKDQEARAKAQQAQAAEALRAGQARLKTMAELIGAAPSHMRPKIYQSMRPQLESIGLVDMPDEWSDDLLAVAATLSGEKPATHDAGRWSNAGGGTIYNTVTGEARQLGGAFANEQAILDEAARRANAAHAAGASEQEIADEVNPWLQEQYTLLNSRANKPGKESALAERLRLANEMGLSEEEKRNIVRGGAAPKNSGRGNDGQADGLSGKDLQTAISMQSKLPAMVRRINGITDYFEKLQRNFVLDGGPADGAVLWATKEGQLAESSAAALRPLLLSFTRVPGIGAQSDLEARLDGMQYPSVWNHPETNKMLIEELKKFIADLQAAYMNLRSRAIAGDDEFSGFEVLEDE